MKKLIVAIPHSHAWFWLQTCVASLRRNPPIAYDCEIEIVVVDNSPWSPAIRGITDTLLGKDIIVVPNHKSNKFHASALDCIVEQFEFDYLMAWETDVIALRPTWLQWFMNRMCPTDYAVGAWHHEQFLNPSCTLYRGNVLRAMMKWCKNRPEPNTLRWGPLFAASQEIAERQPERDYRDWYDDNIDWIAGPFAEKRGWPPGTELIVEPSGQHKGPGWYEPGQQLYHWAIQAGYTCTICHTITTNRADNLPLQTLYGCEIPDPKRQLEASEMFDKAETAHLWGGTRALDIVKHDVTCQFVKSNTPVWLAREARFWRQIVPADIQAQTLELIRKYGWHYTGQGNNVAGGDQRDRDAVRYIRGCYREGGVEW